MSEFQKTLIEFAWYMNAFGFALIIVTRLFSNTKARWASTGGLLLIIAIGNVSNFLVAGINPSQTLASIVGMGIYGSLGLRFIGNWLTDSAT